jgi:hypothetical protein
MSEIPVSSNTSLLSSLRAAIASRSADDDLIERDPLDQPFRAALVLEAGPALDRHQDLRAGARELLLELEELRHRVAALARGPFAMKPFRRSHR